MVKKCGKCVEQQPSRHQPLVPSSLPDRPWQKVAMDLFQHEGYHYLVVVDYFSRYPEVASLTKLTSQAVVEHCKAIFGRHGIPEVVVSDNGPQFNPCPSSPFRKFAEEYGFQHITSSPKFPQSNGMAEAAVKIVKSFMKKGTEPVKALMVYRATPLANGYSPAELLMGRKLRTTLPCAPQQLQPKTVDVKELRGKEENMKEKQKENYDHHHGARDQSEFSPGEKVWVKDMRVWGHIVGKANSPRSFLVQTPNGSYRRNAFHLASSHTFLDPNETFEPPAAAPEPDPAEEPVQSNPSESRYGRQYRPVQRLSYDT
jgi:transposase InsO family protein